MAKFVFINIPSTSHVNSTLPIVQELVARGEEVIYYLTDAFKDVVEATGATFRCYESKLDEINKVAASSGKPVGLPMYMLDESLFVIPQILENIRAEQPDCIIYEILCLSGRLIAEFLHIPATSFRIILAFDKRLTNVFRTNASKDPAGIAAFQAAMDKVCALYPVQPFNLGSIFTHEEPLNIVTVPRAFQVDGGFFLVSNSASSAQPLLPARRRSTSPSSSSKISLSSTSLMAPSTTIDPNFSIYALLRLLIRRGRSSSLSEKTSIRKSWILSLAILSCAHTFPSLKYSSMQKYA